jgi:DNA-binding transcriptional MocR family regulator
VTTTRFRSLASEVGARRAAIYQEIRRCLRLRGGSVVDGYKWIYKTCRELAELLGCCIKTIERDLRRLVELGWLERERHDARWGKQHYYYRLGPDAPLKEVSHQAGPVVPPEPDKLSASKSRSTTFRNSLPARNSRATQQPERKEVIPVPPQQGWPELDPRAAARAIEELRNQIPLLRRRSGLGFA